MKIYDPRFYDLFKAGVAFGQFSRSHAATSRRWTDAELEAEWEASLDAALKKTGLPAGKPFVAKKKAV